MTRRTVRRVEIQLASGRRVNAQLAAFPRRLRVKGSAFLAVLPADAAVTGVKFPGLKVTDGSNTIPMPLRPAARQCGYTLRRLALTQPALRHPNGQSHRLPGAETGATPLASAQREWRARSPPDEGWGVCDEFV